MSFLLHMPPSVILTPDQIAPLEYWFASDSMNITSVKLTSWTDKSGNGRTLTPQGANPDIVAGVNGFDAVDIDTRSVSVAERLETGHAALNLKNGHVLAVMRVDGYGNQDVLIHGASAAGASGQKITDTNATPDRLRTLSYDGTTKIATWSAAGPATGTWALVETFTQEGTAIGININNGTAVTTALGTIQATGQRDGLTLGDNGAGSEPGDCSFTELIYFSSRLTTPLRDQVIDYLVDKYGAIGTW